MHRDPPARKEPWGSTVGPARNTCHTAMDPSLAAACYGVSSGYRKMSLGRLVITAKHNHEVQRVLPPITVMTQALGRRW